MSLKIVLLRLYPHLTEDNIRPCNLVNYTVEVHNKTILFFLSVCLSLIHTHTHACTHHHHCHCRYRQMDWSHILTPSRSPCQTCQNFSCQSQRRNFWITLDQVRLEMTKQGVKSYHYIALISLVRHWYLDGMGIKIKLFSYNKAANLRDLLAATSDHTQIGFKSSIFQPVWPWNLMGDLEKQ